MLDTRRVDDPRRRAEALAVEARGGLVQGLVVESRGQGTLLEVAADDGDGVDRGRGRDAQAAERRDQTAPCGVAEREVVDGGGEDVGDLLRDELLGRRHADVERLVECADGGARLLPERSVRLVAEDEVVRLAVELDAVAREPRVGLDRDRVLVGGVAPATASVKRVAVSLGREVARELRDEQPPVGEDQDPEVARCLDEAGRGDRLPEAVGWRKR